MHCPRSRFRLASRIGNLKKALKKGWEHLKKALKRMGLLESLKQTCENDMGPLKMAFKQRQESLNKPSESLKQGLQDHLKKRPSEKSRNPVNNPFNSPK